MDNSAVILRKAVCLLLLMFILFVWLSPAPFGHAPYPVVYGPRTAFRAYRASLQLKHVVTAMVVISVGTALTLFRPTNSDFSPDSTPVSVSFSSITSISPILRC